PTRFPASARRLIPKTLKSPATSRATSSSASSDVRRRAPTRKFRSRPNARCSASRGRRRGWLVTSAQWTCRITSEQKSFEENESHGGSRLCSHAGCGLYRFCHGGPVVGPHCCSEPVRGPECRAGAVQSADGRPHEHAHPAAPHQARPGGKSGKLAA